MSSPKTSPEAPSELIPTTASSWSSGTHDSSPLKNEVLVGWGWWFGCFLVFAVIAGGVWLRLQIATEPLWLDELHTGFCIEGSGAVASKALIGNQSPFYFWIVAVARPLALSLGSSPEVALRLVSLTTGILLLLGAARLSWSWTHSLAATLAVSFFVAFDSNFVFYATEARPYVLVQFLGLLQIQSFLKLVTRFSWQRAVFTATISGLLFFSHYTSASLFAAEILFLLGTFVWRRKQLPSGSASEPGGSAGGPAGLRNWAVFWGSVAMICALATPHLLELLGRKNYWASVSSVSELGIGFVIDVALWLLPAWCLLMVGFSLPDQGGISTKKKLTLVCLWAMVPTLLVLGLDAFGLAPLALPRYALVGSLGFAFAIPLAISSWRDGEGVSTRRLNSAQMLQYVIVSLFLGACVFNNSFLWKELGQLRIPNLRNENWAAAIQAANELGSKHYEKQSADETHSADDRVPLFLFANVLEDAAAKRNLDNEFQRYLKFPVFNIYSIDETLIDVQPCATLSNEPFDAEQIQQISRVGTCLLLIRATPERAAFIVDTLSFQLAAPTLIAKLGDPASPLVLVRVDIRRPR